jgi:hypothetical protein
VNKLRWGKFYWSDWADDPALALCSLAAQGLWMRLLCIAAQGTPYGHVTISGKPPSLQQLAQLLMRDHDPWRHRVRTIDRLITELERNGVAQRAPCGCLISRRMVRDGQLAETRRNAVNQRQDRARPAPDPRPTRARAAPEQTRQPFEEQQNAQAFVNAELELRVTEIESPPYGPRTAGTDADAALSSPTTNKRANGSNPRALGLNPRARHRQRSRNGMVDLILDEMEAEADAKASDARPEGPRVVSIVGRLNRRGDEP